MSMQHFIFLVLITSIAFAQGPTISSRTKRQKGPRAIGVIRWQADEKGNGHPVLLPVAIIDDGRVFDASIYKTSPAPMALDTGVVYEAQRHGVPVGLFTIGTASHSNAEGHPWIALGKWKLELFSPKEDKNVHQAVVMTGDPRVANEQPPVEADELHRKATQVYDEAGRPIDQPSADEPPTLDKHKKPETLDRRPQVSSPAPAPKPTTTTPQDDPDRPRLKKSGSTTTNSTPEPAAAIKPSEQPASVAVSKAPADPDRPVLKRGRPGDEPKTVEAGDTPIAREVLANAAVTRPRTYEMAAVSDADLEKITQNYDFRATVSERQTYLRRMEALVDDELKPKAAEARSPLRRARPADPSRFADIRFELFDIDSNNSPEIVLTGAYVLGATQRIPFALVARGDYEGNPHKLLFEKTDRFEFIDVVDLDGDGPGEFLFRRVAAGGPVFVIYRSTPDGLTEVFRGGAAE